LACRFDVLCQYNLAAFGSERDRCGSAEEVQTHSGIAPVMEKSAKKKWVHFGWACPKFLRQSFHEWAGHSISQSTWARVYYQPQRGRGKDHHAAVRALASNGFASYFDAGKIE
jgi:hypothetical protein